MSRQDPTMLEWYQTGRLNPYLRDYKIAGETAAMIEAQQPAGDMSDPPVCELTLGRVLTPGTFVQCDLGGGRFEERIAIDGLYLVPPNFATTVNVYHQHRIQVLSMNLDTVRAGLDRPELSDSAIDFGILHQRSLRDPSIAQALDLLWTIADQDGEETRIFVDNVLLFIIARLGNMIGQSPRPIKGGLASWQTRLATEAIAGLDGPTLSLKQLADMVGLSQYHFCRAFKESLGVPPHRYQTILRIERSRAMLESTELSVTEISALVGYETSQAFARAFRNHLGISPQAYRRTRLQ